MLSEFACSVMDMAGAEPVIQTDYIISTNFRAMVDKLCFMSVYGSKTTFEAKVPAAVRAGFHKFIMERHKGEPAREEFAAAWKAHIRANPIVLDDEPDSGAAANVFMDMMGSGDEAGPAGAGAGAEAATPPQ